MLFEQISEAPSAQRLSPGIDEHLGRRDPTANSKPGAQGYDRGLPQRERPFPPSLAKNTKAHRRQIDVFELQPRQLGHPQTRTNRQMQHRPVANAVSRGGIRSVKHRLQLLPQKIGDQTPVRFLERDRQDAAEMLQGCWLPIFEEAEEGLDGRQSDIARHRSVVALIFEILQEGADEAGVELLQRQRRWRDLQSLCSEREEQLEAQGIGVARMPTDAPLAGERFIEERFDKGSNRRHDGLPSAKNPSPAAAMLRMRSAVASRYQ